MKITNTILSYLPATIRKKVIRANLPEFTRSIPGINFRKAQTPEEQKACLSLVNWVYVNVGYITGLTGAEHLRKLPQHDNSETAIFMATCVNQEQKEIPVYTASVFPDGALGLPVDSGFKEQTDSLRQQGRRLVEIGCLASHPDYRRHDKSIPMIMNYLIRKHASEQLFADDLIITTHPKYLRIYEDILLFEPIGKISKFSYVNNNPAIALRQNLHTAPERLKKIYGKMPPGKNLYQFFFGE